MNSFGAEYHVDPQCVISYYIDTAGDQHTTAVQVVHALIKQLLMRYNGTLLDLGPDLRRKLRELIDRKALSSLTSATRLLRTLAEGIGDCSIVIDGIDALQEKEVLAFLHFLRELHTQAQISNSRLKFMIFCRETLGRGIRLESMGPCAIVTTEITRLKHDIHLYVDHQVGLKQAERKIPGDEALLSRVKQMLKDNCAKM